MPMTPRDRGTKKYNSAFASEMQKGTIDFANILVPGLTQLLPDVRDRSLLDVGCGAGRFSLYFAQRGARVTGIDRSRKQIDRASAISGSSEPAIVYITGDILDNVRGVEEYDFVTLIFVILDQRSEHEVAKLILSSVARLRLGGTLLIADLHPHNFSRDNPVEQSALPLHATYFDNGLKFASEASLNDGKRIRFYPNFHYRLDFIIGQLYRAGLVIDGMLEPKYLSLFPTHLLLRASKPQA